MTYLNKTGLVYLWQKIVALIPTNNNQLTNGAGYQTASQVNTLIQTALNEYNNVEEVAG